MVKKNKISRMNLSEKKRKIVDEIDELGEQIISIAKEIHQNPEISFNEFKACKLLSDFLRQEGFNTEIGTAGMKTAFRAKWQGRKKRPCLAYLCEYDALPGVGHGCGHHLIGAASIGAAAALTRICPDLAGAIEVLGTPAEEGGGGKAIMVDKGVFDEIDAAIMFHPKKGNHLAARTGTALIPINIKYQGQSAHAAGDPHNGVNALEAVLQVFHSVNALRQHLADDVRIHGVIKHGGDAPNIVPGYAEAEFYLRAKDTLYLKETLKIRFKQIAEAAALSTGAELTFAEGVLFAERNFSPVLVDLFKDNMEVLGEKVDPPATGYGSSDIGNVSMVVPTIHPYISITDEDMPYHSPQFVEAGDRPEAYSSLLLAAKVLALTGFDLFNKPGKFDQAWEKFKENNNDDLRDYLSSS